MFINCDALTKGYWMVLDYSMLNWGTSSHTHEPKPTEKVFENENQEYIQGVLLIKLKNLYN